MRLGPLWLITLLIKLRLLHLSDLHERGPRERESWRRRRVLGDAWLRNLDELKAAGPFDLACFTGDAADWGLADEYAAATEFFQETLRRLGVPPERFFLVPGNHDVCRTVAKPVWKKLRANLHRVNDQDLSRWLAGEATPWGFQNAQRDALLTRQAAYRDWLKNGLKRLDLLPDPAIHPRLGYRRTVHLPGLPFAVHIIGLDSAWLAGDDHDTGKLRLTEDQAMRLTGDARGEAPDGFRLALIHHPLDDLADGAHCRRLLAERVDVLLRGHLHEPEPAEWADPDRRLRQVAAGCLYEGHGADRYPNACEVIEITLDAQGRPQRYDLRFRRWSGRGGFWFDDPSLYREAKNGRLTWWAQAQREHGDVHPRVEDVFAGRQAELQRLEQVLLRANGGARTVAVCSVQGMAGVGKSYLVDRFYALHETDFPGGYRRLVLDPRQPLEAEALLGRLRDLLQLPAGAGGDAVLRERLQRPLTLVHIENADSWETARIVAQAVPRLAGCPVAVSGRFQGLGESANWSRVPLRPFEENDALDQLGQELGKPATAREYGELVWALGYLPLAIHLAAGHLRAGRSVTGFLNRLRQRGLNLEHPDPADSNRRLSVAFELSLELLKEQLGADANRLLPAFYAFGHGPISGFGACLGAALAGLNAEDFEELAVQAHALSLLDRTPEGESWRWRLHPLLVELLRPHADEITVLERMTDWFVERLPEGEDGQEADQGRRWGEIHWENAALVEWLTRVQGPDLIRVVQFGYIFAMRNGPFDAWLNFCERILPNYQDYADKHSLLLTGEMTARMAGLPDRALEMADQLMELVKSRADFLEAHLKISRLRALFKTDEFNIQMQKQVYRHKFDTAYAMVVMATILREQGECDKALRICQEDILPLLRPLGSSLDRARILWYTSGVLIDCERYKEALSLCQEEILPAFEQLGDKPMLALTLRQMARLLDLFINRHGITY